MPTGSRPLGDIGQAPTKVLAQSTGAGMKLPLGWGGETSRQSAGQQGFVQPQVTGQFRPRSSTMSGASGGGR